MYLTFFKRSIDISVSLTLLIIFSPLFLLITIVLLFINHGKPFFYQCRPGRGEAAFNIIKFKTMTDAKDEAGNLLPVPQRMTGIGNLIRKSSLDELPQLINVFKGDMSLVGPRPLLFKYIELYSVEQRRRHEVRPGITGWAQVNGRNSISWTQKFKYDIEYLDKVSLIFDIKILWVTFLKVVKREGINSSEDVPMPPFNGNN